MAKYAYPAVFTKEDDGMYSVVFKDFEGCYTGGKTLEEAIYMAEDVLALTLYDYEEDNRPIPQVSQIKDIKLKMNEFASFIRCDTLEYKKKMSNKAVKKTLSIPEWLNEKAMAANVNFSKVLQEALMEKLNLA